jgi:aspartate racemase
LYRFTGQSDLVVATPLTGRERQEVQSLIGFFLNTLPIRARMEGGLGFREILRQVRQTVLDAFDHARFPFEKMVELAIKGRDARSQPLHQVMFVFLEQVLPQFILDQAKGHQVPTHNHTSKCDLIFSVMASEQGWDCQLGYACDIFTQEEAGRMAGHLKEMLEAIAEAPQKPIDQLRLMPDSERHQLLVEWNQTGRNYPRDKCAHQIFEEQVNRAPEAVALQCGDVCLSYQEVNVRANRLAHHLRSLGVAPDVPVGLCTERSVEMIVALLGILKAGGAYVPLDPKLPFERLRVLLHDINAPLVLCQRLWRDHIVSLAGESSLGGQVLGLEDLLESLEGSDSSDLPCTNKPGDLAYVMFTSGTTGKPKGVMVPHRGIVRLVVDPDYVELGPAEVLLQFAPISFDASTFEIWGSLLNGAKLVLPPSESFDLAELGSAITGHRVTTLWLTAALFHQMVEQQPLALAGVRQLLSGGDVLMPSRVREYLELPDHGRLINGYGPTENTTFTCCAAFDHPNQIADRVTIGRPISGTRVYILDPRGRPVPTGVAGELYAGGDGLAIGYLKAPEFTSERFVADPFSDDPGSRLYRTGDLVRWRSDGNIDFLGRTDHQVKIRGYRIELGEIEHALRQCNGVSDAVVLTRTTDSRDKQLIAYLQPASGTSPDFTTVRSELSAYLPDYAIPAAFLRVDQLPLNSHGKLDRMALPGVEAAELSAGRGHVAARTELERRLVSIWQKLLGREEIGVHDNFFEIGGHSIQAARLASEIEKLVGQRLPISALFQSPTIALLALRLVDERWVPAWKSLVPLQPFGSRPPLFLLHGWGGDVYAFIELARHLAPEQPVYGIQAVGLDGRQPKHTSVKEMAAHYVEEICSLQPEGPYHLCGFSLGGLIAYETAQQLKRQRKSVAVLALLDTNPLGPIPPLLHALLLLLRVPGRLRFHARQFLKTPMSRRIRYLQGRFYALRNLLLKNRKSKHPMKLPDPETGLFSESPQPPDHFQEVASTYEVARYDGDLDVFVSDEASFAMRCYWRIMTKGRACYHRVPGRHREILSPDNLPALTGALVKVIGGRTKICRKQ